MAEIVNLNRVRKARDRDRRRAEADANAARFGRTLAERQRDAAEADKATRDLDAHRRDRPDGAAE
jgi:regulator of protease activity HflC (stomatin/prohibitin superfamily)